MAQHIPEEFKQEVKRRNRIEEVMTECGEDLEVNGSLYMCRCFNPAHNDKDPSLKVHVDTQSFFCHGCNIADKKSGGVGSDVIAYVRVKLHMNYTQAIEYLAKRVGMEMPVEDPEQLKIQKQIQTLKEARTNTNREYYANLLKRLDVMQYLYQRGLTKESISKWRLGIAPDNDPWKQMRGRLVFGLLDPNGYGDLKNIKTIAFAGRSIDDREPKYVNSTNDEHGPYHKGSYLYGLPFARKEIQLAGFALTVEGYMDVIMAHQIGLENTLGICGTTLTEGQIKTLRELTKSVLLWFDGDKAGIEATLKYIPELIKAGITVGNIPSPQGLDPADVLKDMDKERALAYIQENAIPGIQYLVNYYSNSFIALQNSGAPEKTLYDQKIMVLENLINLLKNIPNLPEQIICSEMIKEKLGISIPIPGVSANGKSTITIL